MASERHCEWQTGFTPAPNTAAAWTDYLGPQPYVDYTIESGSPPVIEEQMRYLAGFGVHAQEDVAQSPAAVRFLHGDLTRSTMMTTDTSATVLSRVAYTAFGDPVTADGQGGWRVGWPVDLGTRYQYDGGWGYESGLISLFGEDETLPPVTLQHVGWRWYQPGIGRFTQRDPIGLAGGLNLYVYVVNSPTAALDALGLAGGDSKPWDSKEFGEQIWNGTTAGATGAAVAGANPAGIAVGAIGGATAGAVKYTGEWSYWCVVDIVSLIKQYREQEEMLDEQRRSRPDVFPPPAREPVEPVPVPACMTHIL